MLPDAVRVSGGAATSSPALFGVVRTIGGSSWEGVLPEAIEAIARDAATEGESFSATVSRLIEEGARATRGRRRPSYVGAGEGPADLGLRAERYLRELVEAR